MKKLSIKRARAISVVIFIFLTIVLCAVCFLPERAITIVSGESYAPIYKGDEKNPQIALMFNVYENTDIVNGILDLLDQYGVKATFFVGGCWADDNNDTLKRIVNQGHCLGNHGYFHKDHQKLSESENYLEINNNHQVVYQITGYTMTLFAPPSGAFSKTTLLVAQKLGYKTVMWSKDTIDWRDSDIDLIVKRGTNVQNGDFVLMHPKAHTLRALPKILDYYKEHFLTPVTVEQCLNYDL